MQIRMFTENRFNAAVGSAPRIKNQSVPASFGAFNSAQCKVTISSEGRKLSDQSKAHNTTTQSAQSLKAEKTMLRLQEQPNSSDEIKNEYLALLEEIDKTINSINNSYEAGGDDVTAEKKQQLIRQMREQKQKQIEENQRKAKEAEQMAMQSLGAQDEVDRNNRELYVMLKSLEESEKAKEEEMENSGGKTEGSSGSVKTENSVSDIIQNSATQFTVSSARRELNVVGMIDALSEEGHAYLDMADDIVRKAHDEAEDLKKILAAEDWTDAEKEEAVARYRDKVTGAYKELKDYRRRGLQMIQDAKECKINHIADNPLQGMEETKESMMSSAVDAAFNEASQGKLDETSQDLEEAVEELIDKRNDVDHVEPDEEENTKEESESIGEKLNLSEQE